MKSAQVLEIQSKPHVRKRTMLRYKLLHSRLNGTIENFIQDHFDKYGPHTCSYIFYGIHPIAQNKLKALESDQRLTYPKINDLELMTLPVYSYEIVN